ncbi:hypothetical protein TNCV_4992991 [Trichonephila clavipes]|nr:hypothetical protein TNCV_4992991 [Trichonephila clavipes]
MVGLKKPAGMKVFLFFRSCCRKERLVCTRTWSSLTTLHQHIFGFRCITTSILHISGCCLDAVDLLFYLHVPPDLSQFDLFFWGHLKLLAYERSVATLENLTARYDVASADIASTLGLFKGVRQ